jgi:hypothetical protein
VRRVEPRSEVLFVGGRSGVGKSSVGHEVHAQLTAADVRHAFIEGDMMDLAHPPPWEDRMAERNLAAMWANYRADGYRRLVYTGTVTVRFTVELAAAMGDEPRVHAVLLTASDATAHARLARRELGGGYELHVARSDIAARSLEASVPQWVHRVATDGRMVAAIAAEVVALTGWLALDM